MGRSPRAPAQIFARFQIIVGTIRQDQNPIEYRTVREAVGIFRVISSTA